MKREIVWSPRARNDYFQLLEYLIAEWGATSAGKFQDSLIVILEHIAQRPEMYQRSRKQKNIRRCVLSKHTTLFYRVQKEKIELITLFDTRQDPAKKKL